jgi:putative flippase GtrA
MPDALGCVTADSDGQHTPDCITEVTRALKEHPDNLILGVRQFKKEDIPWKSWFGNTITIKVFSYVAGMKVSDTQTGLRGIPLQFMKELIGCKGERFEFEMQMLLDCAGKYDLTEIPIQTVYESKDDHQTHFRPVKDSLRIYRILGKKFFKFVFSSVSSFVIDILLFYLFISFYRDDFPGLYVTISTVGARVLSAVYNYLINYKFVFKSKASRSVSLTKYALLAIIQMSLSAGIVSLFVFLLPMIPETVIKCIVDSLLFFVSYTIQQKLVFRSSKK